MRLTSTLRTGMHEYTYPNGTEPSLVIDLAHRDKVVRAGFTEFIADGVSGYRVSNAWAKEQHIYFALKTSVPIKRHEYSSDSLKVVLFLIVLQMEKFLYNVLYRQLMSVEHSRICNLNGQDLTLKRHLKKM